MKPVKLSELIEALELDADERVTKVDLQDGCVVSVERSVVSALEEGDEAALGELPDWQQPEVEIARAIAEDSGERFVAAPGQFDFHEYRLMERFIGTVGGRRGGGTIVAGYQRQGRIPQLQRHRQSSGVVGAVVSISR
jgi:hypothetical protein